jgi:uncharacterized secreted protein with C-terminal beta-propeller domain
MSLLALLSLSSAATLERVDAAPRLEPFESCAAYDEALVDAITEQLAWSYGGYYGWGLGGRVAESSSVDRSSAAPSVAGGSTGASGPSSVTGTNNQEGGVDEQDIVKTDGHYVYALNGQELAIVKSWPTREAEKVGSVEIEGQLSSLFLDGDRVMVLSRTWDPDGYAYGTRATVVDVSDRRRPRVVRRWTYRAS